LALNGFVLMQYIVQYDHVPTDCCITDLIYYAVITGKNVKL